MDDNLIEKLKNVLISEKTNHKEIILKQNSLKLAHAYCKGNNLNGPSFGDFEYNNINFEIKTSLGGKYNNKFNFVQIRLNQNCNYIFLAYVINKENVYNHGELFIFNISAKQIKELLLKYGSYAHGTTLKNGKITIESLNNDSNEKEYCLRPIYNKKC